ncbi:hypothetical protein ONZ45_g14420 [Pleurotus djamor]|nr:hypothetical protein ONZ45_g14420 [Pleurotus djamor]
MFPKRPLSLDIIHTVAGHLQDDEWSLRCASIVCRAWTNPFQQYIFRYVNLELSKGNRSTGSRVYSLLDLLNRKPRLGKYIRTLYLSFNKHGTSQQQAMASIFSHVSLLEGLRLQGSWDIETEVDPLLTEAIRNAACLPRLRHLCLSHWCISDSNQIKSMIGERIPSLRSLELNYIALRDYDQHKDPPTKHDTIQVPDIDKLISLEWDHINSEHRSTIFRMFASHLEELTEIDLDEHHDFAPFTCLRKLAAKTCDLDVKSLKNLSQSLETISIHSPNMTGFSEPQLELLDSFLASKEHFPFLQSVSLTMKSPWGIHDLHVAMRQYMPQLLERGILFFAIRDSRRTPYFGKLQSASLPVEESAIPFSHLRNLVLSRIASGVAQSN